MEETLFSTLVVDTERCIRRLCVVTHADVGILYACRSVTNAYGCLYARYQHL
jgi:hypothetical protein